MLECIFLSHVLLIFFESFVLVMSQNNFGCRIDFESGEGTASIYSLEELQKRGVGPIDTLPFSIRILLEQALRNVEEQNLIRGCEFTG
ncbi:MAG: hypothetical protein Ct9H300mP28_23620 [Pseudomonadota bacterium]|nr:MAG: hypothetical protein Ct9H300mP28_23620 [Pseudomonadota bacterium]